MLEVLLLLPFAADPDPVPSRREAGTFPRPDPLAELLASPLPAARPTLAGRWLDERGAPLAGWTVGVHESPTDLAFRTPIRTVTDRNGRFVFTEHLGRCFALVLRAPDERVWSVREDFVLDGRELVLWLDPEERPTGHVEGDLGGPAGAELANARIHVWREGRPGLDVDVRNGRFRIGPLAPGEHLLSATADGVPTLQTSCTVVEYATRDVGTLRLEAAGWVRVHVAHPGIEITSPMNVVYTALLREGRHRSGVVRNGPGAETLRGGGCGLEPPRELPPRGLSLPLAPGRYVLRTRDWRWVAEDAWVDVRAGETSEVRLVLAPATARVVRLHVPPEDPSIRAWLRVTSADGTRVDERWCRFRGSRGTFLFDVPGLLPGSYRLEARSGSGRTLAGGFAVLDLEPGWSEPLRFDF